MRHRHRFPNGRHLGRHRAKTPPRSRYAVVVTTAVFGAGVVALGTGAALPGKKGPDQANLYTDETGGVDSRAGADGRASRDGGRDVRGDRVPGASRAAPELWVLPIRSYYNVTSQFGPRDGELHQGTDMACPTGTKVFAVFDGVVVEAQYSGGYGNIVRIDHGNGVETRYAHNSAVKVEEGQRVHAGQLIALSGDTGHSTGPHLHLEVRINGEAVDAVPWLRQRGVDIIAHRDALKDAGL